MNLKTWLNTWLELYVKPTTKTTTYQKYAHAITTRILPTLGNLPLDKLTATALQSFTVSLSSSGLSANSVNGVISVLKNSLKRAVSLGVTEKEFTSAIVRPKRHEKQVNCFTLAEQRKIERHIFESKKPKLFGVILCLYTGLRIGELLALKWSDIDLKKGVLSVSKSCRDSWVDGKYFKIIDTPKTSSSARAIPLPKQLLTLLKERKKLATSEFVVSDKGQFGMQLRSYQKTFELLLKRLDLPRKGFHSLRHTFATRALECGMDVKTLSEILGHKDPTVTLKRYAHSLLEHKTQMMNKVGKLLADF